MQQIVKKPIKINDFEIGSGKRLTVITGPCVIESKEHALETAHALKELLAPLDINLIYKSSYDKANRSSINSFRGPGLEKGLQILQEVKTRYKLPITSDIHLEEEVASAAQVCDILQIPAFLCRQLDLIEAAGKSGKAVNVKKGQFMAPWDMKNVVDNLRACGCEQIMLTDRGNSFGYNNLVSDMRAMPIMKGFNVPVCFDASHSVQLPGGRGSSSGGQREFIPTLARAAVAAGADCIFLESHPDPAKALSDKESVYPIAHLKQLLEELAALYKIVQTFSHC